MKQLLYRAALAFFLTVIIVSVSVMLRHSVFSSSVIGVDTSMPAIDYTSHVTFRSTVTGQPYMPVSLL